MVNFCVELLLVLVVTNVTYCYQYGSPFLRPNRPKVFITPLQVTVIQIPRRFSCLYSLDDMLYLLRLDATFIIVIVKRI